MEGMTGQRQTGHGTAPPAPDRLTCTARASAFAARCVSSATSSTACAARASASAALRSASVRRLAASIAACAACSTILLSLAGELQAANFARNFNSACSDLASNFASSSAAAACPCGTSCASAAAAFASAAAARSLVAVNSFSVSRSRRADCAARPSASPTRTCGGGEETGELGREGGRRSGRSARQRLGGRRGSRAEDGEARADTPTKAPPRRRPRRGKPHLRGAQLAHQLVCLDTQRAQPEGRRPFHLLRQSLG